MASHFKTLSIVNANNGYINFEPVIYNILSPRQLAT